MTENAYDGTPIQEGLTARAVTLTGEHAHFSITGLREMVVVDVNYVDDPRGNRTHAYVEYTCRDLYTGEEVPHCRQLKLKGGVEDGDDHVLHMAQKLLPGSKSQKFTRQTQALDTDGERVLVGFMEGSRSRGVILGVLGHTNATYNAKVADGERRLTLHKGASIEIDKDGNIRVQPAPGKDVFIGNQGATENLVLGQLWKTMMSTVLQAIAAHVHPTGTGPSGPPSNAATYTTEDAGLSDILSDMAFTQKEQT